MSLYVWQAFLDGVIPLGTHRVHFKDEWNSASIENDVTWDGVTVPIYSNLSWETWATAHSYVGNPLGHHHITADCYDVSNTFLATFSVDKTLAGTAPFTIWAHIGLSDNSLPPFELPLGYNNTYPYYGNSWWVASPGDRSYPYWDVGPPFTDITKWFPPPNGIYFGFPVGCLDTVSATTASNDSHIVTWGATGGTLTVTPILDNTEVRFGITVGSLTTPGTHPLTTTAISLSNTAVLSQTLNVYDGFRWYLIPSYLPGMSSSAVYYFDVLSGSNIHATLLTATPDANFTFQDGSSSDMTAGIAITSEMQTIQANVYPTGTPSVGTHVLSFTVTDSATGTDVKTVEMEVVSGSVIYPGSQPMPGQFQFELDISCATPSNYSASFSLAIYSQSLWDWNLDTYFAPPSFAWTSGTRIGTTTETFNGNPSTAIVGLTPPLTTITIIATPVNPGLMPGDYNGNLVIVPLGGIAGRLNGMIQSIPITITKY
jgi:hypothetical protein